MTCSLLCGWGHGHGNELYGWSREHTEIWPRVGLIFFLSTNNWPFSPLNTHRAGILVRTFRGGGGTKRSTEQVRVPPSGSSRLNCTVVFFPPPFSLTMGVRVTLEMVVVNICATPGRRVSMADRETFVEEAHTSASTNKTYYWFVNSRLIVVRHRNLSQYQWLPLSTVFRCCSRPCLDWIQRIGFVSN